MMRASMLRKASLFPRRTCNVSHLRCSSAVQSGVAYAKTLKDEPTSTMKSGKQEIPTEADCVVVGGGVIGSCLTYHLTKMGMKNVVLLEKHQLTSGTTWHTAGLVWHLRPSDTDVQLLTYTWDLIKELGNQCDNTFHIENGGLFIANRKQRLDEYKRLMTIGRVFGIESEVLSPEETRKKWPLLNTEDLYGTLYSPTDGTVDPAGYCLALTRAAEKQGARVLTGYQVTKVDTKECDYGYRRVQSVQLCPTGVPGAEPRTIRTKLLVNAAGAWAPSVAASAGVDVPLCAIRHAYIVTNRIEQLDASNASAKGRTLPFPNVRDHDLSIYLRVQGDSLAIGGYEANPVYCSEEDVHGQGDTAFRLFDLDWNVFGQHIDGAMHRMPQLREVGIKSTVCGVESFTPDHRPLIGESVNVRGFWLACAYNSGGMMYSGGTMRELAKWMVRGQPDLDMFVFDVRRFSPSLTGDARWIRERSHEAYAKNYSVVFKHDEPLAGRHGLTAKSAIHDKLLQAGCVFQERHQVERPGWFDSRSPAPIRPYDYYGAYDNQKHRDYTYEQQLALDYTFDFPKHFDILKEECLNCRRNVSLFDMSYFGKYYLFGPDAQKAVDWLFTADMRRPAGRTVYTCMLNDLAGVEADLTVSALDTPEGLNASEASQLVSASDFFPNDSSQQLAARVQLHQSPHAPRIRGRHFYLAIGGAVSTYVATEIRRTLSDANLRCHLLDASELMSMLSLQGPLSRKLLADLTSSSLSNDHFPFSSHKLLRIPKAHAEMRAMRLSFVGELGWELHLPTSAAPQVFDVLHQVGAQYSLRNAGYRAIDSLSIEKGYRHWHADLRNEDSPLEAGLEFTCKLRSDVPFRGRKALEAQKRNGLRRKLVCFTLDDRSVALHGLEAIVRDGQYVGFARRGEFAFALDRPLAYGYVERHDGSPITDDFLRSGSYQLERMGQRFAAQLHLRSPFDPDNKRVRGLYN